MAARLQAEGSCLVSLPVGEAQVQDEVPQVGVDDPVTVLRLPLRRRALAGEGILRRVCGGETEDEHLRRLVGLLRQGPDVGDRVLRRPERGEPLQEALAEVQPLVAQPRLVKIILQRRVVEPPLPGVAGEVADRLADGGLVPDAVLSEVVVHGLQPQLRIVAVARGVAVEDRLSLDRLLPGAGGAAAREGDRDEAEGWSGHDAVEEDEK